jgi:hypothetical protein
MLIHEPCRTSSSELWLPYRHAGGSSVASFNLPGKRGTVSFLALEEACCVSFVLWKEKKGMKCRKQAELATVTREPGDLCYNLTPEVNGN